MLKCDEELAWELADNQDLFDQKMSTQKGFEFAETCLPKTNPGNGPGNRGELQCCGSYPSRVPYHDGKADCCNDDKIFNTKDKKCCNNGSVIGSNDRC